MNFVISIIKPECADVLNGILDELNLPVKLTLPAYGTAVKSMLELLGIDSSERRVMMIIADGDQTKNLITKMKQGIHLGVPGHGIVLAVPIKSIGGGKTVEYLKGDGRSAKYSPPAQYLNELIIAIANVGHTDDVMNAARAAGARGGTVIHAKGTGINDVQKFMSVSIADEKEIILIVSPAAVKSEIMSSILKKAGPDTESGAIVFSLPVSEAAGFAVLNEQ